MKYTLICQRLCERGQRREKIKDVYYEKHHIIPKCMGGNNSISNLTILTAREHFLAHRLLCKININNTYSIRMKLASAFNRMCSKNNHKRHYKSADYETARKAFSENHPMKDPKIREKLSNSLKKRGLIKKREREDSLPLCLCGCGNKIKNIRNKYLYNHWDHTTTKKGFSDHVRKHLSIIAKKRIGGLSEEERADMLKKSLHSGNIDHIMRGNKISAAKKGKKTNQKEITGKRFALMTDDNFESYLKTKSHYVWKRYRNLRNIWKKKI